MHKGSKFNGGPNAELEPNGFPVGKVPELFDEPTESPGGAESVMIRRGRTVFRPRSLPQSPSLANLVGDLVRREDAPVGRFGALAEFDLNHLNLRTVRVGGEHLGVEYALAVDCGTTSEITCSDIPNEVTAIKMELANPTLPGVVVKEALR